MENILKEAHEIVYDRSQEKDREYGGFHDSMITAGNIAGITTKEMYMAIIALKLSRLQFKWKRDSALDLIAYIASFNDYTEKYEKE